MSPGQGSIFGRDGLDPVRLFGLYIEGRRELVHGFETNAAVWAGAFGLSVSIELPTEWTRKQAGHARSIARARQVAERDPGAGSRPAARLHGES
jgi:hypothetical protein